MTEQRPKTVPENLVPDPARAEPAVDRQTEVALWALEKVQAAARAKGLRPGMKPARKFRSLRHNRRRVGCVPIGDDVKGWIHEQGWESNMAEAQVLHNWEEIVGTLAHNVHPQKIVDGILTVSTRSTAWALQMKLFTPQLLEAIENEVGPKIVNEIKISAPEAPSWSHGPYSVPGRGPRDTYG